MKIVAEYTGQTPNLKPAASAFIRALKNAITPDGHFKDPELDAEFQEWMRNRDESKEAG